MNYLGRLIANNWHDISDWQGIIKMAIAKK